ncbi:Pollen-specific protein-like protein [Quillaja saponaria]|uniref:Pollen-specific protein-like protein n=1 Tax=Quillaja saponaria TaxID=32244 RepID=A0AAD7QI75_QUISA|nr:Pollen-specific protein-like protein [Quillaja saponaria]
MARQIAVFALIAVCLFGFTQAHQEEFAVQGKVYCDPCRVQFETKLSKSLSGAFVHLECRSISNSTKTIEVDGKTDANGFYKLLVTGDHEEEYCEVSLKESNNQECKDVMEVDRARVGLTNNNGDKSIERFANALGFMTREVDPACVEVLKELFTNLGDDQD